MTIRQTITNYDDVMMFGKYQGKTVDRIAEHEPGYIVWLVENKVVECDEEIYEAACRCDVENSPPESWFFPDLGSK